jgi:UPF0755 protein
MIKLRLNKFMRANTIIILIVVLISAFSGWLYYLFFTPNLYEGESPKKFIIQKGSTLDKISLDLIEEGIIKSQFLFKVSCYIQGLQNELKHGRHKIPNGLSYLKLAELLAKGAPAEEILVVIPEGFFLTEIASRLKKKLEVDSVEFMKLARDENFLKNVLNHPYSTLEGFLLPDSYYFFRDTKAEEAIKKLYQEYKKFFVDSLKKRAEEIGMDEYKIITLASIVQYECKKKEEMPIVAGVYYNRLQKGMKLESCPTVIYAMGKRIRRLLEEDLKINSPYNTYIHKGLPPGPIGNPGKDAILATLYPSEHQYFFFAADGNGGHRFSKTFDEHVKAANIYRKWLSSQKIRR